MKMWILGVEFSVNEKTVGFQGNNINKVLITYKAESDVFHCEELLQDVYTFTSYFLNQPAPKNTLDLSPTHYSVLSLFDCIQHKFSRCEVENVYKWLKFSRFYFKRSKQVIVEWVTRKGHWGLPTCATQGEQNVGGKNRYCEAKQSLCSSMEDNQYLTSPTKMVWVDNSPLLKTMSPYNLDT